MRRSVVSIVTLLCLFSVVLVSALRAGVSKLDGTLPIGTPLAGYNYPPRRTNVWPLPDPKAYTTWMSPSTGVLEPTWVKALVLDDGNTQICLVTIDAIGSDANLNYEAYLLAYQMGFRIAMDNVLFSGAHTHSGPGAISSDFLWAFAPATDLLVPELRTKMATTMATAMVNAVNNLQDAVMDIGSGNLTGVTHNRRWGISPTKHWTDIDPIVGVIRVDDVKGAPIATLWNFAIHGICYDAPNLMFSGDIMGMSCQHIEEQIGGVAMFTNADAGDINPVGAQCDGAPDFVGSHVIADAVVGIRNTMNTTTSPTIKMTPFTQVIDFGPTDLNATLGRFDNCTHGGMFDICTFCEILKCDINAHLDSSWIENQPRFSAINFNIDNDRNAVIVTAPGEPLLELGWWIRNDTYHMGFNHTLLFGYTNAHMGYFAPPDEYDAGGYESQLTFWGITTAQQIRDGVKSTAQKVVPQQLQQKMQQQQQEQEQPQLSQNQKPKLLHHMKPVPAN